VSALMGLVTLTFHLLTLKLVRKSHRRWGIFIPNLGTLARPLGSQVFAVYATDGWTDRRAKANLTAPLPTGGGIII